jgi:hypothetical protein
VASTDETSIDGDEAGIDDQNNNQSS